MNNTTTKGTNIMNTITRIVEALTGLNTLVEVEVGYFNPDDLANGDHIVIDFGHSTPLLVEVLRIRRTTSHELSQVRCGIPHFTGTPNISFAITRVGDPDTGRTWGERIQLSGAIHSNNPDIFRVISN
jgi:hypothetical protein